MKNKSFNDKISTKIAISIIIIISMLVLGYKANTIKNFAKKYMADTNFETQQEQIVNKAKIENYNKNIQINESRTDTKSPLKQSIQSVDRFTEIPTTSFIESQFICQAPLETEANWVFHEESCEEAALLQVYLNEKSKTMTKEEANKEILKMIEWQKQNFGGHHDIYAEKIKAMALGFYNLENNEVKIIENASIKDIKQQISLGHTVMAPVTSLYLENPYYEHPGYHMLQVIGYTEDHIITNDNGTRRGESFAYQTDKFEKALLDAGADILVLELK